VAKRAVLYARVSRDDRGEDNRNLTGQFEMCREYAQQHGWQITAELAEDDRGASGAEIDLPELNRIRDMAAAGEFDVLVVREIDRLSRNLAKQLIVEQELRRDGVQIQYAIGEYPDTPEGRLNKHIKATIAEYEREKIAERTTRARRQKVKAGHVIVHGRPPYGYRLAEVDGKRTLAIHEPEARVVRLIYQWYTVGDGDSSPMSIRAIVYKLRDLGACREGRRWSKSTVQRILSSETYAGTWYYGKYGHRNGKRVSNPESHWLSVEVPATVSRETWAAAQQRRHANKQDSRRNVKYQYLLSKRLFCAHCRCRMHGVGNHSGGSEKLYLYYRCPAARGYVDYARTCDNKLYYSVSRVDTAVWVWIKSFLTDTVALAGGLKEEQAEREKRNKPLRERLVVIDDLLADNRCQLERLLDLYLSGDFPRDVLTERQERLRKTIAALGRERAGLTSQLMAQTLTDEQVQTITEFARKVALGLEEADASFEARRRVVELLDVQAELAVEEGQKVLYARCVLGEDVLCIASTSSCTSNSRWPARRWDGGARSGPHPRRPRRRPRGPIERPVARR
jgi:site-specific DNA recombinase